MRPKRSRRATGCLGINMSPTTACASIHSGSNARFVQLCEWRCTRPHSHCRRRKCCLLLRCAGLVQGWHAWKVLPVCGRYARLPPDMAEAHTGRAKFTIGRKNTQPTAAQSAKVPSLHPLGAMAASVNKGILVGNLGKRPVQEPKGPPAGPWTAQLKKEPNAGIGLIMTNDEPPRIVDAKPPRRARRKAPPARVTIPAVIVTARKPRKLDTAIRYARMLQKPDIEAP